VRSSIFRGSNEFEDFWCHRSVTVLHSITGCHVYLIFKLADFLDLCYILDFLCHNVTFNGVTLVPRVTHVTYVIATCHWPSKVFKRPFKYPVSIKSGSGWGGSKSAF
jgi:hypothetical protein